MDELSDGKWINDLPDMNSSAEELQLLDLASGSWGSSFSKIREKFPFVGFID